MEHVVIIGGGGTGAALAHDLTLRGFEVSLFERGEFLSGTTGRHHGLLHSGARYAVHDPVAARECIQENKILREIAPAALEQNDGLFVALNESDLDYRSEFIDGCRCCGIPATELTADQARTIEPSLHPDLKLAVQIPDATMDPWRLPMHFSATARANGARIKNFSEAIGFHKSNGAVTGVRIFDHQTHREYDVRGDVFVNATGAWAAKVCDMAGIHLPVQPGPGAMVAVEGRLTNMVVNRLHKAAEADIIVPQRRLSLLGATLWLARDPDKVELPSGQVQKIVDACAQMVPAVKSAAFRSVWWASRPLIAPKGVEDPQQISRDFDCFDHKDRNGIEGLVSVIGGKATTLRAMAEKTADLICKKTGRDIACRTKTEKLLHYRMFFKKV
ncbi:MAG: FAD-dependent oxidoreductase [Desulfobacterales bacterium]|nr:MAG: FAD-dependent oxidoreductase [Desulfobacterales bacterium]